MPYQKENTRKRILLIRNGLTQEEQTHFSTTIHHNLLQTEIFQKAQSILFYYSFGSEVKTPFIIESALKNHKEVSLPVIVPQEKTIYAGKITNLTKDLRTGHLGIKEPLLSAPLIPKTKIDLVIIPGIGYNQDGTRLGYGHGYYDRFLQDYKGSIVAIAFSAQITDKIIPEKHDVPVHQIVTEKGVIECK